MDIKLSTWENINDKDVLIRLCCEQQENQILSFYVSTNLISSTTDLEKFNLFFIYLIARVALETSKSLSTNIYCVLDNYFFDYGWKI